jgi:hypothetical protein
MSIHSKKIISTQIIIFVLILVVMSLGQMARWDLLQQIAMSDRYSLLGNLYPDTGLAIPTGASAYFPGVSLIALVVKNIVPSNLLIYSMHLSAVLVVISFFIVQRRITYCISKDVNLDNFYIGVIIFSLILCRFFLMYAVEFKPDTIAFLLGSLGIIIAKVDNNAGVDNNASNKIVPFVLGASLTGCALIFKQQYIAFLAGMIIYSFVSKNYKFQIFTALSIMFSILILYIFSKQENLFFWTVTNLSNDGFVSIKYWVLTHAVFIIHIAQSIIFLYGLHLYGYVKIDLFASFFSRKHLFMTPWPILIFMSTLAAFVSAWKVGGNPGNTQLGLMLLFPLIYFLIQKFDKRLLILIVWVTFLSLVKPLYQSVIQFQDSTALNQAASSLVSDSNTKVLTGSDVYGAARMVKTLNPIHDLWIIEELTKTKSTDNLDSTGVLDTSILSSLLADQNYDIVILENRPNYIRPLRASSLYSIRFENNLGVIAVRN